LLLLLVLASFVQVVAVNRTVTDQPLRADAGEYFSYAFNLDRHGTYSIDPTWQRPPGAQVPTPDAYRPPGYPLFLRLVGHPEPTDDYLRRVVLVQAMLGVASVALLFLLARRFLSFRAALAAAALTALSPQLAVLGTTILSETLFCFLLLASLLATMRAVESRGTAACVLAGLLWGATSLVRSTTQFLPPLLLAAALLSPALQRFRRPAAIGLVAFVLALSPWMLRNLSAEVRKPASSLMVKALAHGSYPNFMYEDDAASFGYPYRFDPQADVVARDLPSVLRHIAGRFHAQPFRYLRWYLIGKPGYFLAWGHVQGWDVLVYPVLHSPYYEDPLFRLMRVAMQLLHWPLMLLGLLGAGLACSRSWWPGADERARWAARLASALVGYGVAFHMVVAPFPRYGLPFRPLLYALALLALGIVWRRARPASARKLTRSVTF
jgi:4-amino-4-deoxy-L-arabinose transferase-like glycosyltransferase